MTTELHGIISTGQSLSVGASCLPMLDVIPATGATYEGALKLVDTLGQYDPVRIEAPTLTLDTLIEPIRPLHVPTQPFTYPGNILGGTFHTAMGRQIATMRSTKSGSGTFFPTVHTVVGQSSNSLASLGFFV